MQGDGVTGSAVSQARVSRKFIGLMVGVTIMVFGLPSASAMPVLPGDINLDGKVNVSDVQCHVLASANPDSPPDLSSDACPSAGC